MSPSDASYRLVERQIGGIDNVEMRWHSETIEALADIFMSHPVLLVVFGDTNAETLDFVQLVRNNRHFRELPIFAVLPEPQRMRQKMDKRLNIEKFSTPLDSSQLYARAKEIIKAKQAQPFKL